MPETTTITVFAPRSSAHRKTYTFKISSKQELGYEQLTGYTGTSSYSGISVHDILFAADRLIARGIDWYVHRRIVMVAPYGSVEKTQQVPQYAIFAVAPELRERAATTVP